MMDATSRDPRYPKTRQLPNHSGLAALFAGVELVGGQYLAVDGSRFVQSHRFLAGPSFAN
jgi:hypothetical protein